MARIILCLPLILLLGFTNVNGQITDTKVGENLLFTRLYAGVNSNIQVPIDSLETTNEVSFRIGAEAIWTLNQTFSFKSLGAVQANSARPTGSIATFEFITKISKTLQLNIGLLPGPVTKLRPNPISWQGHTELYAQTRLVGTEPGVVLKFNPKGKFYLSYGLFKQNGTWASLSRIQIGNLGLAGFYQTNREYFAVMDYTKGRFRMVTNYSSQFDEMAWGLFVPVSGKIVLYSDANYFFDSKESTVLRLGIRHHYANEKIPIRGFFALQYDFEGRYFTTQLMIHI